MVNNIRKMKSWIDSELKTCRELHYRLSRRLNRMHPSVVEERLTCSGKEGRVYYSEVWVEDGERKTRYLGNGDNREVVEIKEKRFLKKALSVLDSRIKALEGGGELILPIDFEEINESLPKVYRLSPEQISRIVGPDAEEKWFRAAVAEKEIIDERIGIVNPEGLIHRAKDGTLMRSKSETSIANELINRGIPYIYEMPVKIKNIWMHPDFMFYSHSRMKPMMWEHAGMLGDEGYMESFSFRMDTYIRGGFVPCVDILFSFDTKDGRIDSRMIDAIIDEYR